MAPDPRNSPPADSSLDISFSRGAITDLEPCLLSALLTLVYPNTAQLNMMVPRFIPSLPLKYITVALLSILSPYSEPLRTPDLAPNVTQDDRGYAYGIWLDLQILNRGHQSPHLFQ